MGQVKKTAARVINETRVINEEWVAAGDPIPCRCGHDHYGRLQFVNGERTNLAPQYHVCENSDCGCTSLRQVI